MRGGQADDEASGIYGQAIQDHNELLNPLAGKFESLLQDLIQAKNRQENAGQTSTLGKLKVSWFLSNSDLVIHILKDRNNFLAKIGRWNECHTIRKSNFCPKIQFWQNPNIFTKIFFWQFFSWNQSCQQLKSPKPQHFHEFFTQKDRQFSREIKVEFLDKKWRFRTVCECRLWIILNYVSFNSKGSSLRSHQCSISPYFDTSTLAFPGAHGELVNGVWHLFRVLKQQKSHVHIFNNFTFYQRITVHFFLF